MRTLFIAVSKVFGLVVVYSGLAYITTVLPIVYMLLQGYTSSGSGVSVQTTLGSNLRLQPRASWRPLRSPSGLPGC
jgi:hypothetical protein